MFSDRKMAKLQNRGSLPNWLAAFDPEDSRAELGQRSAKLQTNPPVVGFGASCTKTAAHRRRPGCRATLKMANRKAWQPSKLLGSLRKLWAVFEDAQPDPEDSQSSLVSVRRNSRQRPLGGSGATLHRNGRAAAASRLSGNVEDGQLQSVAASQVAWQPSKKRGKNDRRDLETPSALRGSVNEMAS